MGKQELHPAMLVKVDTNRNNEGRPSTTTATTSKSITKNSFRFPRFSLRSPSTTSSTSAATPHTTTTTTARPSTTTGGGGAASTGTAGTATSPVNNNTSTSSGITPRTYRRLRSFPLLRIRTNPADASETSVMTSMSPQDGIQSTSDSSSSTTTNSCSISSCTCNGSSSQRSLTTSGTSSCRRRREAREDFVMRCTKILTVQNSSGELQETTQEAQTGAAAGAGAELQQLQPLQKHQQQPMLQPLEEQWQPPQSPSSSALSSQQGEDQQQDLQIQMQPYQNERSTTSDQLPGYSCATAILQHSYLEMVCGRPGAALVEQPDNLCGPQPPSSSSKRRIPDDPTVQDSIECVFASQLEEGLPLWEADEEYDEDDLEEHRDEREHLQSIHSYEEDPINAPSEAELPSPAPLMQSRQKSRTPLPVVTKALIPSKRRSHPSNNRFHLPNKNAFITRRRRKYQTAKMVHVGTFDPRTNRILEVAETDHNLMEENPAVRVATCSIQSPPRHHQGGTCSCHSRSVPVVPPDYWPQAPLLLRPTPGANITVLGIRFSGQTDHFWTPAHGGWWLTPLYEMEGKEAPSLPPGVPSMCPQCCLLPINNGNEPLGEALVTDFETPLFEGTLLVRLRHVDGGATSTDPDAIEYDDTKGYFAGLNRRYQVVIRGKFKKELPLTGMVAGCVMDRPVGRLPPKWIMKGAVKVLSFFAPQLEVQMDCPRPKTMAPLGSTPQALVVQEIGPQDELPPLDGSIEEPHRAKESLLGEAYHGHTSLQRARGRKKAFDKLYAAKSKYPTTKTSSGSKETYYTFEFLQHLVNFQEFSVELGNLLGSIPIAPILAGQPIPIMAMTKKEENKIWSFDIWHHNLVEDAKNHDAKTQAASATQ